MRQERIDASQLELEEKVVSIKRVTKVVKGGYRRSTELLNFGLGLSVVALGYLMYEQLEHMRGRLYRNAVGRFLRYCLSGSCRVQSVSSTWDDTWHRYGARLPCH